MRCGTQVGLHRLLGLEEQGEEIARLTAGEGANPACQELRHCDDALQEAPLGDHTPGIVELACGIVMYAAALYTCEASLI